MAILAAACAWLLIMTPNAFGAQQVITSSGPLTNIYLNDNLGCQVDHTGTPTLSSSAARTPAPAARSSTRAERSTGRNIGTAYSLVSQTGVTGSGTNADPYKVVTVVDVGSTGLRITQTDAYVVGDEFYRSDIEVSNSTGSAIDGGPLPRGRLLPSGIGRRLRLLRHPRAAASTAPQPQQLAAATHLGLRPAEQRRSHHRGFYWHRLERDRRDPVPQHLRLHDPPGQRRGPELEPHRAGEWVGHAFALSAFSPTGEPPPTEICNNGIDDDGDGLVDGEDPDCPQDDPPTYGDDVDTAPVSGTVRYKPPGSTQFQTLTAGVQVPVGTIFDTRDGRVRLTSAKGPGSDQTQTADFYAGLFQVRQPDEDRRSPTQPPRLQATRLHRLHQRRGERTRTPPPPPPRPLGQWPRTLPDSWSPRLASVRGTTWFTQNRCDGTYFEVREGTVVVKDFTRDRTIVLHAGENYLAPTVTTVEAGDDFNCGLPYTQKAICWGDNTFGQATPPGGHFTAVSAGDAHACGLRPSGKLRCWGSDGRGQATPPAGTFTAVSAGGSHACGLRSSRAVACWGRNLGGQASPPSGRFEAVSAGASIPARSRGKAPSRVGETTRSARQARRAAASRRLARAASIPAGSGRAESLTAGAATPSARRPHPAAGSTS